MKRNIYIQLGRLVNVAGTFFVTAGRRAKERHIESVTGTDVQLCGLRLTSTLVVILLFISICCVHAAGPYLLVSDFLSKSVLRLDTTTGAASTFIDTSHFNGSPNGMAIGPDGQLYVVDTDYVGGTSRVLKFDAETGASFGSGFSIAGGRIDYIAIDASTNIFVSRDTSPCILKFNKSGVQIGSFLTYGTVYSPQTTMWAATGLGIGPDNLLYVGVMDLTGGGGDIVRLDLNGNFIDTFVNSVGNSNGYRKLKWSPSSGQEIGVDCI